MGTRLTAGIDSLVSSFVPATALGVRVRDFATLLMRLPAFPRLLMGGYFNDAMRLPDYALSRRQAPADGEDAASPAALDVEPWRRAMLSVVVAGTVAFARVPGDRWRAAPRQSRAAASPARARCGQEGLP